MFSKLLFTLSICLGRSSQPNRSIFLKVSQPRGALINKCAVSVYFYVPKTLSREVVSVFKVEHLLRIRTNSFDKLIFHQEICGLTLNLVITLPFLYVRKIVKGNLQYAWLRFSP